jgi:hypothetical protein
MKPQFSTEITKNYAHRVRSIWMKALERAHSLPQISIKEIFKLVLEQSSSYFALNNLKIF